MNKNKVEVKIDAIFSFNFSDDITCMSKDWEKVNGANTYLSAPYLKSLQNSNISFLDFIYVILYKNQEPLGCVYFQRVALKDSLLKQEKFPNKISKLRSLVLKYSNTDLLLCGNFFATGVNGFFLKEPDLEPLLPVVVDKLSAYFKKHQNKVSLLMFKEFWIDKNTTLQQRIGEEYGGFQIDVNMILDIDAKWNTFSGYLAAMKTKYRTRAKGILQKTTSLVSKEFVSEDILNHEKSINHLLANVIETSDFNVVQPNAVFFYQLKLALKELVVFKGYFFQDKLVAFSVATFNESYLDANFVGIDYTLNTKIPIYQRLLYDYVNLAIEKKVKRLRLGRTAEIMKSSLGAIPVEMNLYIKHTHVLLHKLLKPTLSQIQPSHYEIRKPFKA